MNEVQRADLRAQVARLMSILAMEECDQKIALDSWGFPAQNKDDLAEELQRLITIIKTNRDCADTLSKHEFETITSIDQIFAVNSGLGTDDFWEFGNPKYQEEWRKIGSLARRYSLPRPA
ncbi:hypothetical protein [Erythrobacter ani]|uniref:Uncharacterized protein n=1 Tax=Erythrobacter ani TaxID=2827235 RepID=A0ABS6SJH9_9SPHN|nr:hypothetical protein [Erythrobacter ani]MBV7265154.1 hypothetical protein [Erythrobacter ani]